MKRWYSSSTPIRDNDIRGLEGLLREGGFVDVASKLDRALTMETRVLAPRARPLSYQTQT